VKGTYSRLLLLEEGRNAFSGETNKKEKNHLYLSPSAAEELETVLKQHLLFPLLFRNNTYCPFFGETWTSSLSFPASPTTIIAEIGIDSESESSLYGSANDTLSSTHTLRDDEMSASGTAALDAKHASRPAKGGGGDPQHGNDKSEHVYDFIYALGGDSRDKSVSEHVDEFEGKNKPNAWATVASKSQKGKER
jgi:hypothetical protein